MHNKSLHKVGFLLLVIGGINWGLIGLFNFDLVDSLLGFSSLLVKIIYILVGMSAIYELATHKSKCQDCSSDGNVSPRSQ